LDTIPVGPKNIDLDPSLSVPEKSIRELVSVSKSKPEAKKEGAKEEKARKPPSTGGMLE
jgi:hypothetical protein